jgi:hypothetical protein
MYRCSMDKVHAPLSGISSHKLRLRIIEPPTSARHLLAELVRDARILHSDYDKYTLTFTCVCQTSRYRGR